MRLFNADGSRAEVSGNGVRALGALLLATNRPHLVQSSSCTPRRRQAPVAHRPRRHASDVSGRHGSARRHRRSARSASRARRSRLVVLDMGNPAVRPARPAARSRSAFERLGAALERHAAVPDGTNVEFAQVEAPGPRADSDLGARRAVRRCRLAPGRAPPLVAAAAFGGAARSAEVVAPGGAQRVEWMPDSVYLTGWAEVVCEGEWLRQPSGSGLSDPVQSTNAGASPAGQILTGPASGAGARPGAAAASRSPRSGRQRFSCGRSSLGGRVEVASVERCARFLHAAILIGDSRARRVGEHAQARAHPRQPSRQRCACSSAAAAHGQRAVGFGARGGLGVGGLLGAPSARARGCRARG